MTSPSLFLASFGTHMDTQRCKDCKSAVEDDDKSNNITESSYLAHSYIVITQHHSFVLLKLDVSYFSITIRSTTVWYFIHLFLISLPRWAYVSYLPVRLCWLVPVPGLSRRVRSL
eukprot:g75323.t1